MYPPAIVSMIPMVTPPRMAPGMLSSPPRITAARALSPTKPSAKFTPSHNPNRIPPTAPAIEAKAQAYAKTRRRLTPRVLAVNWSFAAARIAIPTSE